MDLLRSDRAAARRQVIVMGVLAVVLAGPAYLLWPWMGLAVHAVALALGLGIGFLLAKRRASRYETSLRGTWTQWMRFSVASESIPEIYRRVSGRSSRNLPYKFAVALVVAWAIELLLLVLAFRDETSTTMAIPAIAYNAILAGLLMAYFIHRGRWTQEFGESVKELVESGELGLWGVL